MSGFLPIPQVKDATPCFTNYLTSTTLPLYSLYLRLIYLLFFRCIEGRSRSPPPLDSKKMNIQKLNAEISPHRAVSAVRLLRIEQGGAFADLLNEKGRKAAENEISYVERTLGFRTRDLDDRDIRLVLLKSSYIFLVNTAKGFKRVDLVNRLEALKVPYELSSCLDDFVRIHTGMQIVIQAGLLKDGICSVQDESAGLVVSVVDPQPGDTIIDCCAAPGGKTIFMASCLRGKGTVMAIDINRGRLRILKEACKLLNVANVVTTTHADLRLYAEKHNVKVDKVLLDAPCSGTGVLSKRADLRWNRQLEDMEHLKHLQDELLDAASMLVKPGGILVYSTCSIDPEENEERVAAFLLRHPVDSVFGCIELYFNANFFVWNEFVAHPVHAYVPPDFVTDKGFFFSNPVKRSMDGSFAARLSWAFDPPMSASSGYRINQPTRTSTSWGIPQLNWNFNKSILPEDKKAFEELLGMKVPKLSQLMIDQSLFDFDISLIFP
ncbi:hypothetical protein COCNU_01G013560 [Cocos nucifera]|uniref:SAM-dependent MTase RsmB/NOP-type domain-containing protein n=1 Tax=Cocos nucifera TaxID=13894 RepID=A0A8K0HVH4_COCNU|nr:hypothetical protein COCNU_01G013560 [Cocos nucifera]